MANPEHLKILKQGVEVWNVWREENPNIEPDLMEADLDGASLDGVNLDRASLVLTHLENAHLIQARLVGARLERTRLDGTRLIRAKLNNAVLDGVSLVGTRLDGANFDDASVVHASVVYVDLSRCEGLQNVEHLGPSAIATSTLERTAAGLAEDPSRHGEIEAFLRGAGLENHWIDYFRSRIGEPIEFYSCFISYSHTDTSIADLLHTALQERGIRCWKDDRDLKPGDRILDEVGYAIESHDKILLCCSETSLNSRWVKDEIRKALERECRDDHDIIIPLMVDRYLLDGWDDGLAADLRSRLAADFTGWEHDNDKFEEQFERVVKALGTDENAEETAPEAVEG